MPWNIKAKLSLKKSSESKVSEIIKLIKHNQTGGGGSGVKYGKWLGNAQNRMEKNGEDENKMNAGDDDWVFSPNNHR
ncbi:MAG: hypothetical protein IKD68_02695 [Solobacterium sp.]|nr:hypothetical protein [Solobacterium sp.]